MRFFDLNEILDAKKSDVMVQTARDLEKQHGDHLFVHMSSNGQMGWSPRSANQRGPLGIFAYPVETFYSIVKNGPVGRPWAFYFILKDWSKVWVIKDSHSLEYQEADDIRQRMIAHDGEPNLSVQWRNQFVQHGVDAVLDYVGVINYDPSRPDATSQWLNPQAATVPHYGELVIFNRSLIQVLDHQMFNDKAGKPSWGGSSPWVKR